MYKEQEAPSLEDPSLRHEQTPLLREAPSSRRCAITSLSSHVRLQLSYSYYFLFLLTSNSYTFSTFLTEYDNQTPEFLGISTASLYASLPLAALLTLAKSYSVKTLGEHFNRLSNSSDTTETSFALKPYTRARKAIDYSAALLSYFSDSFESMLGYLLNYHLFYPSHEDKSERKAIISVVAIMSMIMCLQSLKNNVHAFSYQHKQREGHPGTSVLSLQPPSARVNALTNSKVNKILLMMEVGHNFLYTASNSSMSNYQFAFRVFPLEKNLTNMSLVGSGCGLAGLVFAIAEAACNLAMSRSLNATSNRHYPGLFPAPAKVASNTSFTPSQRVLSLLHFLAYLNSDFMFYYFLSQALGMHKKDFSTQLFSYAAIVLVTAIGNLQEYYNCKNSFKEENHKNREMAEELTEAFPNRMVCA